ncbi:MAG: hypothetical protein QW728_07865, partial [Thermoplasmata archaeon]
MPGEGEEETDDAFDLFEDNERDEEGEEENKDGGPESTVRKKALRVGKGGITAEFPPSALTEDEEEVGEPEGKGDDDEKVSEGLLMSFKRHAQYVPPLSIRYGEMEYEIPANITVACSDAQKLYFAMLEAELKRCLAVGKEARRQGKDPELDVEIPLAEDLAMRVENQVGPPGISVRIRELSKEDDNRESVALKIAMEVAARKGYKSKEEALDQAVRTGLSIVTEGILVAPLEGIEKCRILKNEDGTEYIAIYYSGPIRAAGGTGQALSVLIADVVRQQLNLGVFKPTDKEVERYKEEFQLYPSLQYMPTQDEIELIMRSCPICITGEGTEQKEVTGNRDLPRVETNQVRGGALLVIAEGLCLKAPKIQKHVKALKISGWDFINKFVEKGKAKSTEEKKDSAVLVGEVSKFFDDYKEYVLKPPEPKLKFIHDIIAGRPVFSGPSAIGGFRLRYGRGRTCGLAALAISPATMAVLNSFLAIGTQMKIERPGKACAITPCTSIDGPMVLLHSGDFIQLNTFEQAEKLKDSVALIVDLGQILVPAGEFVENNHKLVPGDYCIEWWEQEVIRALETKREDKRVQKLVSKPLPEKITTLPDGWSKPSFDKAMRISQILGVPLHPDFNFFFDSISVPEMIRLRDTIRDYGQVIPFDSLAEADKVKAATLLGTSEQVLVISGFGTESVGELDTAAASKQKVSVKNILLRLGGPFILSSSGKDIILTTCGIPLTAMLGLSYSPSHGKELSGEHREASETEKRREYGLEVIAPLDEIAGKCINPLHLASRALGVKLRQKSCTRIGGRMGRPEKAAARKMKPPPHILFPVGLDGGPQRLLKDAAAKGKINADMGMRTCSSCGRESVFCECQYCGGHTVPSDSPSTHTIDIRAFVEAALRRVGETKITNLT